MVMLQKMKIIFSLIAGMMLGIAQISTRYLLILGLRNSFNLLLLVLILYLFSALIWLNLLKNNSDIGLLYSILILGSLSSILIGNQVLDKTNFQTSIGGHKTDLFLLENENLKVFIT